MFCIVRLRRLKQPAAPEPPVVLPPVALPLLALPRAETIRLVPGLTFQLGDYEVGEGYCPQLCGHPGIRY